jgi:hypothetical protein
MSDKQDALTPIRPERLAREIREMCAEHNSGQITELQYEQRFARMIGEVRDRRLAGDRAEVLKVLNPLREDGTVTAKEWDRLIRSLGLV